MAVTYQIAQDEVFGIVKAVIDANQASLFGYTIDVRYPGVPKDTKPDMSMLWARASSQIVSDGQSALSNVGGVKRYDAIALLYVQLFSPRNVPEKQKSLTLAELLRSEFRKASPSGNLSFFNQKIVELPEEATNYPTNVVVEFRYQTVQ